MKIRKYLLFIWLIGGLFFLLGGLVPDSHGVRENPDYFAIFISTIFFGIAFFNYLKFWKKKSSSIHSARVKSIQNLSDKEQAVLLALEIGPENAIEALRNLPSIASADNPTDAIKNAIIDSIPVLTDKILEDGIFSKDEEKTVTSLFKVAGISYNDISPQKKEQLIKAAILRDLLEGALNPRINIPHLPFNLQKSEILIWAWQNVNIHQNKTVSEWKGGSRGFSIRIAKGVYYRFGATKGQKVSRDVQENLGTGPFVLTNKHIYYKANNQAKRMRLEKIISTDIYGDGIIIHSDGVNSKPLVVLSNDAWFMGNCINNAQNWA